MSISTEIDLLITNLIIFSWLNASYPVKVAKNINIENKYQMTEYIDIALSDLVFVPTGTRRRCLNTPNIFSGVLYKTKNIISNKLFRNQGSEGLDWLYCQSTGLTECNFVWQRWTEVNPSTKCTFQGKWFVCEGRFVRGYLYPSYK